MLTVLTLRMSAREDVPVHSDWVRANIQTQRRAAAEPERSAIQPHPTSTTPTLEMTANGAIPVFRSLDSYQRTDA